MQDKAKAALEHAMDEMAQYYDHWRSPAPTYEVGAKVWLNAQNYMTTHPTVTPVTHQPCTAALDLMQVQPHHMGMNRQTDCGGLTPGMDH